MMLTDAQIDRFSRQLLLDEMSGAAQERLLASTRCVTTLDVGARSCLLWLARIGVGQLIIPRDTAPVDEAMLPDAAGLLLREDGGMERSEAVRRRLAFHRPDLRIECWDPPSLADHLRHQPHEEVRTGRSVDEGTRAALAVLREACTAPRAGDRRD